MRPSPPGHRRRVRLLATGLLSASVLALAAQVAPSDATTGASMQPRATTPPSSSQPYTCQGVVTNSVCTLTFASQGQVQSFTVPQGVSSINVEASGAYGGGFCDPYDGGGAPGGVNGTLAVDEGEVIKFVVGEPGAFASLDGDSDGKRIPGCFGGNGAGGYGGGGNGGFSGSVGPGYEGAAGGGGGATTLIANGTVEFVAGGGGGTGQGGMAIGYLQPGVEYIPRPGSGGAGGGGVNRPQGTYLGTAAGFGGEGVGSICACTYSGSGGGTLSGPGAGGAAGLSYHGPPLGPPSGQLLSATAEPGASGAGPANAAGAGVGGQGAGASNGCELDATNDHPEVWDSEGGGGGGGYYGGGGGGCGRVGGGGGGGGSSFYAPDVTSGSFTNRINPPIASLYPTLNGHYSNVAGGLLSLAFPVCSDDSSDTSSSQVREAHAVGKATGPSCPLDVTVKQQNNLRSGLSINDLEKNFGPVNFTSESSGGGLTEPASAGLKCNSGCANLLVTVTLPNSTKTVPNATVAASVAQATGDSSDVISYGTEFLCVQTSADVPTCGTYLSGLQTDSRGQVHLLYWAPGVRPGKTSSTWQTTLTVKAMKCSTSCGSGERQGESDSTLTVKPYPIYHRSGQLSAAQVQLLIDLVKDGGFNVNPADTLTLHQMTETTVEYFEATEREALASLTRLPAAYGEIVLEIKDMAEAVSAYGQQGPLGGTFLQALNLSAIGFDEPPFQKQPPLAPNDLFMGQLEGGFSSAKITPGTPREPLYTDAKALEEQMSAVSTQFATPPENISVTAYEVSTCNLKHPYCGPGFAGSPGIQPGICLVFTGSDHITTPPLDWSNTTCPATYDPVAWVRSQKGVDTSQP